VQQQQHWEKIYASKSVDQVSWYRPHLERSLALIERAANGNRDAAIVDVGGGASTLVDDLIDRGYTNITVVDIAQAALDAAQLRLGQTATAVHWVRADVTEGGFPSQVYDVWHDRAVFHFLTEPGARRAYVQNVAAEAGEIAGIFLKRHLTGDWGEVDEHDRRENELSVVQGFRLLSVYTLSNGTKLSIIKEADRSATMLLLPLEY
jgi:SAM-dependent methyltransferase